jgi:hypothetical protein
MTYIQIYQDNGCIVKVDCSRSLVLAALSETFPSGWWWFAAVPDSEEIAFPRKNE